MSGVAGANDSMG